VFSRAALPDLALAKTALDRSGLERRDEGLLGRLLSDPATKVLELRGDRAPVAGEGGTVRGTSDGPRAARAAARGDLRLRLRPPEDDDAARLSLFAGRDSKGTPYVGVVGTGQVDDPTDGHPDRGGEEWLTLRQVGAVLDDLEAGLFATVLAIANWHATHAHCSRCGTPTVPGLSGWLRVCPTDGSEHYPRTDPAVIMAVVDPDDRLLLGRGPGWPEDRFSVLAGFVEPGESFEAAVAREVDEEVGIAVTEVRYLGNQPWPFPSSIMIGFTSRARQTAIEIDPHELEEARWVTRDEYRDALLDGGIRAPVGLSIAKRIIEDWLGESTESVLGRRGR
jgi:NAD+ diphosphatase